MYIYIYICNILFIIYDCTHVCLHTCQYEDEGYTEDEETMATRICPPYTSHSTPCALLPTPDAQRPTPYALHPTPYTPHP